MSGIEEIVRMRQSTRSNGMTEGFHLQRKCIQRQTDGLRIVENVRLRARSHCRW